MPKLTLNLRLLVIGFVALSVALPIALISLAKLLLALTTLTVLLSPGQAQSAPAPHWGLTPKMCLLAVAVFGLSLLWSTADATVAAQALLKHSKLLSIVMLMYLIRTQREAVWAVRLFVAGQLALLASSWLLVLGVSLPWRMSSEPSFAVFSSYLDQSIMTAVLAALVWHLRELNPFDARVLPPLLAVLALAAVFFAFQGRTGHVVGIAMLTLAAWWWLPPRYRAAAVLLPVLLLAVLFASSGAVRERLLASGSEVQAFSSSGDNASSSGIRLHIWQRSLQAMSERPLLGSGVGSWNRAYDDVEARAASVRRLPWNGNPHQEYLLWGVELGGLGLVLLLGWMVSIYRDALPMAPATRHALLSLLAALAIASLFNCSLRDALIGDYFCVALGLLLALGRQQRADLAPHAPPS